uniref:Uncharacterized protein n=1 Tax=Arion vulgaris TaxID=1028688 RepID=A0A0B7BRS6_9EUPU
MATLDSAKILDIGLKAKCTELSSIIATCSQVQYSKLELNILFQLSVEPSALQVGWG